MKYQNQKDLEKEAGERLDDRWTQWSKFQEPYRESYKKIDADYMCDQDESSPNTARRSRLKYPHVFSLLETLKPISFEALVGEKPYIGTMGRGEEDDAAATVIQGHQTFMLDQADFPLSWYYLDHQRMLHGTTYAFCPWMLRYGMRKRDVPRIITTIGPKGMPVQQQIVEKKELDVKIQDNIEVQDLDPKMIAYDPAISDAKDLMDKGEGVIRQWYTSVEEIKANARKKRPDGTWKGIYPKENVDELMDKWAEKKTSSSATDSARDFTDKTETEKEQFKDQVLMREGWMKLPATRAKMTRKKNGEQVESEEMIWDDDAQPRECVVTKCVTTGTVLRVIFNPTDEQFRPFLAATCYPVPGRVPGLSFARVLNGLLKEMELLKNSRLDYINFILRRPWVVNVHSGIQVRDSFNIPDRIIKARDINGIKPLDVPDYGGAVYRDIGGIEYEIQNAAGVLSAGQDASKFGSAFGETATGVNYFQNVVGARTKLMVRIAEMQFFAPLGKMLFLYGKQFVTKEEFFRVMNVDTPYVATPESYTHQVDFIPIGAHERIGKGQMVALLDRFLTVLPQIRDLIKVEEVIKDYMKLTGIAPNPARLMLSPEEQASRAKMAAESSKDIKPKLSISLKGEDLPPDVKSELFLREFGIRPQPIPNVLNPVGVPTLPGTVVGPNGLPGGVNGAFDQG